MCFFERKELILTGEKLRGLLELAAEVGRKCNWKYTKRTIICQLQ